MTLEQLENRLRTILPEEYQDTYNELQPLSMGSASLKYGEDGKVAWDEIWDHFCDLAMAGGPPHKGKLLEPGLIEDDRYQAVVKEICRGVRMVTDLVVTPSPIPGWVRVDTGDEGMAAWLVRAIVMENISARLEDIMIDLPAGGDYRLEKEIKNVVTVMAKTFHYWDGHMWAAQQQEIAGLFAQLDAESPLTQPALAGHDFDPESHRILSGKMAGSIREKTGLHPSGHSYAGWLGVDCLNIPAAVWMMRAMVASNVLARREETVLFVPVNPRTDPTGEIVVASLVRVCDFAATRKVL